MGNCCFEFTPPITQLENQNQIIQVAPAPHPESTRQLDYVQAVPPQPIRSHPIHLNDISILPVEPQLSNDKIQVVNDAFDELLRFHNQISNFYANHDVDSCMPLIQKLQKITDNMNKTIPANDPPLEKQLQNYCEASKERLNHAKILPSHIIQQIKSEHADILHYEHQISNGNWKENSFQKGVRLSTRREDGSVGVLIQLELELPFQVLISILIEMDLYSEFIPFNEVSRQEKIYSRNCRIGYNLNNYPFLAKREAYFEGIGYSRLKTHQEVFLFTRSIHDKPELQRHLQFPVTINTNYVQLTYKYFVVKYRPIRSGKGKLVMALNADIGLNFLPNFILQMLAKDFAKSFIECVVEIGKKFKGSKWEKNVEKKPDLFLFFKREIDDFMKQKQQQ